MTDLAATLLEFFGQPIPADMTGKPLHPAMAEGTALHDFVVFGYHGGEIIVTDGKYLYMNAPEHPEDSYYEYTLMPTHMRCRFTVAELADNPLAAPFSFTKGLKTMKIRCNGDCVGAGRQAASSRLFDIEKDPRQLVELDNPTVVSHMKALIASYMKETDAPQELYHRYGIVPL